MGSLAWCEKGKTCQFHPNIRMSGIAFGLFTSNAQPAPHNPIGLSLSHLLRVRLRVGLGV